MIGMVQKTCSECGRGMPDGAWSCPHCGNPGEPTEGTQISAGLTRKGWWGLLVLFIVFPSLLLLLRILIYNFWV